MCTCIMCTHVRCYFWYHSWLGINVQLGDRRTAVDTTKKDSGVACAATPVETVSMCYHTGWNCL